MRCLYSLNLSLLIGLNAYNLLFVKIIYGEKGHVLMVRMGLFMLMLNEDVYRKHKRDPLRETS